MLPQYSCTVVAICIVCAFTSTTDLMYFFCSFTGGKDCPIINSPLIVSVSHPVVYVYTSQLPALTRASLNAYKKVLL